MKVSCIPLITVKTSEPENGLINCEISHCQYPLKTHLRASYTTEGNPLKGVIEELKQGGDGCELSHFLTVLEKKRNPDGRPALDILDGVGNGDVVQRGNTCVQPTSTGLCAGHETDYEKRCAGTTAIAKDGLIAETPALNNNSQLRACANPVGNSSQEHASTQDIFYGEGFRVCETQLDEDDARPDIESKDEDKTDHYEMERRDELSFEHELCRLNVESEPTSTGDASSSKNQNCPNPNEVQHGAGKVWPPNLALRLNYRAEIDLSFTFSTIQGFEGYVATEHDAPRDVSWAKDVIGRFLTNRLQERANEENKRYS